MPQPISVPTSTPPIALKRNGKSFSCPTPRCRSKNFFVFEQTDIEGIDLAYYQCAVCQTHCKGGPDSGFEEQIPQRNDWRTPNAIWQTLHKEYKFNIDAAADRKNSKSAVYFGPEDGSDPDAHIPDEANGLKCDWFGHDILARQNALRADGGFRGTVRPEDISVYVNPPYNPKGSVATWLQKAIDQAGMGVHSVLLVPMATSVAWFNDLVVPYAEWHSWRGRIAFDDPAGIESDKRTSPKQDNLLVVYNPNSDRIGHCAVRDARTGEKLWTRP